MVYESSYESGRKPFVPDLTRGYWAQPSDFIYACLGFALKTDILSLAWYYSTPFGAIEIAIHLLRLVLYIVPIMVIQSFMGQFSSSGFMSVFRIAPLFKGMGYISLAINFAVLTYYSIFANIPLLYFFNSLRPTLPWSCAGFNKWAHLVGEEDRLQICNVTRVKQQSENETDFSGFSVYQVPSLLYFRSQFDNTSVFTYEDGDFFMSWQMMLCNVFTWTIIALIFYNFFNVQKLGQILRYSTMVTIGLLLICTTRFLFLPGALDGIVEYFVPKMQHIHEIPSVLLHSMSAFGAGWGAIVTLASFNRFKTNIMRYSWIICISQMLIFMVFGISTSALERHFSAITNPDDTDFAYVEHQWILYLSSGSALAQMEMPNLWSILYFGMLALAAIIVMVIQLFSMLISIFDEFEILRAHKTEVIFGSIGVLSLISFYFCSNHGVSYFSALSVDAVFTQIALNLLLLLVVLWIYGRVRFQRDIEFMLGHRFSTWKINVLRFVAPLFMLITLLLSFGMALYEHYYNTFVMHVAAVLLIVVPWLFIPGYAIYSVLQTSGGIKARFKRCCRPTDWYPIDTEERQRYEEAMGNLDITHQLKEVNEEVL